MAAVRREVYDAFRAVGVEDDTAWKAAEALSEPQDRLTRLEERSVTVEDGIDKLGNRLSGVEGRLTGVEGRLFKVEARLDLLAWMVGVSIALSVMILGKLLLG